MSPELNILQQLAAELAALRGEVAELRAPRREQELPPFATHATAEQLAARYQLSVEWVQARSSELGATPISDAANSKLRYHLPTADAYMEKRRRGPKPRRSSSGGRARSPRAHSPADVPLVEFTRRAS
jgi:hypothetical protein